MFAANRGSTILPVDANAGFGPLYWVASKTDDGSSYFVKMANYAGSDESITVRIPGVSGGKGSLQLLTGPADGSNHPLAVDIKTTTDPVDGSAEEGLTFKLPAWSVGVLVVSS